MSLAMLVMPKIIIVTFRGYPHKDGEVFNPNVCQSIFHSLLEAGLEVA
jgi:hypothetical protein